MATISNIKNFLKELKDLNIKVVRVSKGTPTASNGRVIMIAREELYPIAALYHEAGHAIDLIKNPQYDQKLTEVFYSLKRFKNNKRFHTVLCKLTKDGQEIKTLDIATIEAYRRVRRVILKEYQANQIALSKIPKELESYYRKVAGENFLKYLDKFICTGRQNIKKFKKLKILCDRWYNELVKTLQPTSE
jgi:hypothetical protein